MSEASSSSPPKLTFWQQMASFPRSFWVANLIELIERFSFYGVRTIAALYIVGEAEKGGLALSNTDKGVFFGTWSLIQCLLPMFTGGFSDRYGYRVSLMVAFGINIIGYAMMGYTHSWWSFMFACCLIGTGTAIFKPPLHGTLAHCVNESNSSVGWGMFYQVVNIGGFIGPIVTGYLRLLEWKYAFFAAAGIILVNVLVAGLFLKDYAKRGKAEGDEKPKGPLDTFVEAMATLKDVRFIVFLAIFSGFWFMFMQLFDQLSIFIEQWVDSNDVATFLARITGLEFFRELSANGGQVNPEWIVNVDAGSIIIFVLLISFITGKFKPISAMIVGMFIACIGLIYAGTSTTGWACILGIFIFAVGEMACSPKFSEYVGLMAPPEKKALYMGYSNIPFAVGWSGANFIGGPLYDHMSDKHELARDYLVYQVGQDVATVEGLTKGEVMPALAQALGETEAAARTVLWNHYHPQDFWYLCMSIGLLSTLAMVGYHFWLKADVKRREAQSG
ncbi:MAG: MFS transporter [Phycisphaerales bacterium]|nr:MAG: MFS transporter [Phycisphaerales bacterium]